MSSGIQQALCFLSFYHTASGSFAIEKFAERISYLCIAAVYVGGKSIQENMLRNEFYLKQELQMRTWQGGEIIWAPERRITNQAAKKLNILVHRARCVVI